MAAERRYVETPAGSWLGPLKMHQDGQGTMTFQPKRAPGVKVPSIVFDLKLGTVKVVQLPFLPDELPTVLGILGLARLEKGAVLALISKAKRVSGAEDALYHVEEAQLVAHEAIKSSVQDVRVAALLQEVLDPKELGSHLYFSHLTDITQSAQRIAGLPPRGAAPAAGAKHTAGAPGGTAWARADPRFCWNASLMQPLLDAGAGSFATPVMVGYVGQVSDAVLPGAEGSRVRCRAILIGRVAAARAGTWMWRKGLDAQGNSAHLVESELRLVLEPESASSTGGTCSTGSTDQSAIQALPEPWEDAAGAAAQAEKAKEAGAQEGVGLGGAGAEGPSGAGSEKEAAQAVPTAAGKGKAAVASGSGTSSSGGPGARTEASFVVLRGCVPCMWAAPPDLRARPKARIARSSEAQAAALHAHVAGLSKAYKCGVTLVHLEGSHPDDQLLAATAATAALAKAQKQAGGRAAAQGQGEGSSKAVSTSAASTQPLDGLALVQGAQAALLQLLPVPEGQQGGYQTPGSAGRGDAPSALLQDPIAREALLEGLLGPGGLAAGHGHFMQVGGKVLSKQGGVVRLSGPLPCDAVNLVQADLGLAFVASVLHSAGCLTSDNTGSADATRNTSSQGSAGGWAGCAGAPEAVQALHTALPELDKALRTLWGNHGTVIADQIMSSSCLSSFLLPRGPEATPTLFTQLRAAATRVQRYGAGHFNEAHRQDALDVLTGAGGRLRDVRLEKKGGSYSTLQLAGIFGGWALIQLVIGIVGRMGLFDMAYRVGVPLAACMCLLGWCWFQGTKYIAPPQVVPQAAQVGS